MVSHDRKRYTQVYQATDRGDRVPSVPCRKAASCLEDTHETILSGLLDKIDSPGIELHLAFRPSDIVRDLAALLLDSLGIEVIPTRAPAGFYHIPNLESLL